MGLSPLVKEPPPPRALEALVVAFLLLLHLSSSVHSSRTHSSTASDRAALLSFKSLLINGPSEALASWNETLDFCRWKGITCGGRRHPQRVAALDLGGLYLAGTLSPALGNLTFLRSLRLPGNRLSGRIPPELGRLSRLQHLDLSSNSLSGGIPSNLSRCSRLRNITLRANSLEGEIPISFGSLPGLHSLNLALNSLSGHIPPSLGNLCSITVLILSNNALEGGIPPELGDLPSLRLFSVGRNHLLGKIPPSIFNLSFLEVFDAGDNQLTGTLPGDIGHALPHLQWFLVSINSLEGNIPASFPNASGLEYLEMKYNGFSGSFPSNLGVLQRLSWLLLGGNRLQGGDADGWSLLTSLTNCSNLVWLDIGSNLLSGALPRTIGNLSRLESLQIGAAQISGAIPPEIGNLVNLIRLNMQRNSLTRSIPETVGKLRGLEQLTFAGNRLSGEIPSSMGNLTRLTDLSLNINELTGNIPGSLANCPRLQALDLSDNALTGTIPTGIFSVPSLSLFLDLSDNSLSGPLPADVGLMTKVGRLFIYDNRLAGEIPTSLGDCRSLEYVYMGGNLFQGGVPRSLGNLRALRRMDLSRNELSGSIPSFFGGLQMLETLNLSFNDFEGEVPSGGVFDNLTVFSVSGNKRLCGGNPKLRLPACPTLHLPIHNKAASHRRTWKLVVIVVAIVISVSLLTFLLLFLIKRYGKGRTTSQGPSVAWPGEKHVRLSYFDLLRATNGFSAENLIGTGSFGSVYKGTLTLGDFEVEHSTVAVKVLNLRERGAARSFVAECEALRSVRHRNLAKIITSCSSINSNGNDFKALVFQFMPNGSLERWVHPRPVADDQTAGRLDDVPLMRLSFLQRLGVAIDVATALDYLHNHGQAPIVHCDLKPSNVLLDSDMNGVVSDFGLARFIFRSGRKSSTGLSSTPGIKGSIGYIAPEYGVSSKASPLGDVYSYGILLLELFTGRRPTDDAFGGDLSLRKYVEMAFPEQVMNIIDPHLLPQEEEEEEEEEEEASSSVVQEENVYNIVGARLKQCIISVIRTGLSCSNETPKDRMEIRDVIKEMHLVKGIYIYNR